MIIVKGPFPMMPNGKCAVIVNPDYYLTKCKLLLEDQKIYEMLVRDLTQKYRKMKAFSNHERPEMEKSYR